MEEWKNDASFTNRNLSMNDSQQIKNDKTVNINKKEINEPKKSIENKIKSPMNKGVEGGKNIAEEKDEIIEGEIEEEEEDSENSEDKKEKNIITETNSEMFILEEEEEEFDEDEDEEEKEIINNNKTSFNVNIKFKEKLIKSLVSKSNIIKNLYEIDFLLNKLIYLNPISFTLLYKGTQDSDNTKIFHQKCDREQNILLFILTSQNYIFGGYTSRGSILLVILKKIRMPFCFQLILKKFKKSNMIYMQSFAIKIVGLYFVLNLMDCIIYVNLINFLNIKVILVKKERLLILLNHLN